MSGAYWSAINEHLPEAALVFDHFHIIKLANNKIGRLTRMAYGYRDVDFLHLRIYALHESKNILTGT